MFEALINTMAPVFIIIAIGFAWQRTGFEFPQQFITRLVMNIGAPCLIVSTLSKTRIPLDVFTDVALATIFVMVVCGLIALPFALRSKVDPLAIVAPVAVPNTGNMGLSVCLFAFGEAGLSLAIAFFLTSSLVNMSIGIPLFSRRGGGISSSLKSLAGEPLLYASIFGVLILVFDWRLPTWAANTTGLIGDITIPLMLLTLGVSLCNLSNTGWLTSVAYSLLRFGGGLVCSLLAVELLGITGLSRNIVILQSMMPAAVFNYLLAAHYHRSPEITAGIVITSTALAFILLPIVLAIML